jgi:DNA repair exonuclease SbcCD ATPase subunit
MTYGDYVTKVPLSDLGTTLITGHDLDKDRSCGAGKTTVPEAIIWCLFGRITKKDKPGDHVVNWFNGKDCYVEIKTTDGYIIRRTRKMSNHADLLIYKPDGTDISSSTNTNAQVELCKIFNLDYNVFATSMYFGQFAKPILELSEQKRRKILEDYLHISHLMVYADIAKSKHEAAGKSQQKLTSQCSSITNSIEELQGQIERTRNSESEFENDRKKKLIKLKDEMKENERIHVERIQSRTEKLTSSEEELSNIELPDGSKLDALKTKWETVNKIKKILRAKESAITSFEAELRAKKNRLDEYEEEIEDWKSKLGTTCSKCEQRITDDHVTDKNTTIEEKANIVSTQAEEFKTKIISITAIVKKTKEQLESSKPSTTVESLENEHDNIRRQRKTIETRISELKKLIEEADDDLERANQNVIKRAKQVNEESNPYKGVIEDLESQVEDKKKLETEKRKEIEKYDIILNHLQYIRSAYSDRKKIKAFILSNSIPFFNQQIDYYLRAFDQEEAGLKFNTFLQAATDRWPYFMHSGGESRGVDLALMFAVYDLHALLYGSSSNVMVFDEVDGRMDRKGIECFVNIINNDLAKKDKIILIISHRDEMRDAFSSMIHVEKKDEQTRIKEIRV